MAKRKIRLNILAYNYPPIGLSGTIRNLFYSQFFSKKFKVKVFAPGVIATQNKVYALDPSLNKQIPKKAEVVRIKTTPFNGNYFQIKWRKLLHFFFYVGSDYSWFKQVSQNKEITNCDVLLISVPPFSSISAIRKQLQKNKPKILIIDFRDPWNNLDLRRKNTLGELLALIFRYRIENQVLQKADLVLVTSEIHKKWLIEDFPKIDRKKIKIIYNGLFNCKYNLTKKIFNKKIIYAGSFSGSQDLEIFIKLIKLLPNFTFYFVGKAPEEFKTKVKNLENIKLLNYMPREKLIKLQNRMDFGLAAVKQKFSYAIPTKIFEYLESNIPIVGIFPQGAAYKLIKKEKIGFAFEPKAITKLACLLKKTTPQVMRKLHLNIKSAKYKYSRQHQTKKLEKFILEKLR